MIYEPDYQDETAPWKGFFALHRSGALDVAFSEKFGRTRDEVRFFHLIGIVGRVWAVLVRYSAFIERWNLPGPFHLALGLRDTSGAHLGGLAEGWRDPLRDAFGADGLSRCVEPNVLLHDTVASWPSGDEQGLAFRLGGWIEDAWGVKERRFLARTGEHMGQFDPRSYR